MVAPTAPTSMMGSVPPPMPMASRGLSSAGPSMSARSAGAGAHSGTATVSDGAIVVAHGSPTIRIDAYQDALCPICGAFEQSFGADIDTAIDDGRLGVTYRMLTFLDPSSASGTYSTRASAALLCVASWAGSQPGLFQDFHAALFAPEHQPAEGATTDLSNADLAELAATVGAPANAAACIRDGVEVSAARAEFTAASARLTHLGLQVATPTIVRDGRQIMLSNTWLTDLLAGG